MKKWSIAWSTTHHMGTALQSPMTSTAHWKTLSCTIACTPCCNTMTPWMFGCHIQYTPKPQPRLRNMQRNTNSYRLLNTQRGSRLPLPKCNWTERETERTCLLYPARTTASRCIVWSFALQWFHRCLWMGFHRLKWDRNLNVSLNFGRGGGLFFCLFSKRLFKLSKKCFVLHLLPFV